MQPRRQLAACHLQILPISHRTMMPAEGRERGGGGASCSSCVTGICFLPHWVNGMPRRPDHLSVLPLSLVFPTSLMSFVELHNANPWLGERYYLHRSLSHARLQAARPSESEIINCRCWSTTEKLLNLDSWYLAYFIASTLKLQSVLLISHVSVG